MRKWLRDIRVSKNLTQATVAKKLGINQNTYSRLETGIYQKEMNLALAAKISDIFNIPLSTIRNYEEGRYGNSND